MLNVNKKNGSGPVNVQLLYRVLFCGHGDSLLDPSVAAEQREHEASDVASPHAAAFAIGHKVPLIGEELLRC